MAIKTVPTRVQRKRTKGYRLPPDTRYVGRPTRWGNPFRVGMASPHNYRVIIDAEHAVELYRQLLESKAESGALDAFLSPLRAAKHLACWCPLDKPCHVDVIIEYWEELTR